MKRRVEQVFASIFMMAVSAAGQSYSITTVAGSDPVRDGKPAYRGVIDYARHIAFDASGRMFIAEYGGHRIRMVTPDRSIPVFEEQYAFGEITTLAGLGGPAFSGDGGPASLAHLSYPSSVAIDDFGNIFVAESDRIRRIGADGRIQTVAGGGAGQNEGEGVPATSVRLLGVGGLALDAGRNLYFSDSWSRSIRRVGPDGLIVTHACGGELGLEADGGPAREARLLQPGPLTFDKQGNLLVCEQGRFVVRKVTPDGRISTVVGTGVRGYSGDGGPATRAQLTLPVGIAVDSAGNLLVADSNQTIRSVAPDGSIQTIFGPSSYMSGLASIAIAPDGRIVLSSSSNAVFTLDNRKINQVLPGSFTTYDDVAAMETLLRSPSSVTTDREGHLYIADFGSIRAVDHSGTILSFGSQYESFNAGSRESPTLYSSTSVVAGGNGDLWIGDYYRILRLRRSDGSLQWVAGTGQYGDTGDNGPATQARIESPSSFAVHTDGSIFLRSVQSNTVRRIGPDGVIRRFAGNGQRGFSGDGGSAVDAQLSLPGGLAIDSHGTVYIADTGNRRVRAVSPAGIITTFAGGGALLGDGPALSVAIPVPLAIAVGTNDDVFFSTATAIYRITSGSLERIAGGDLPGYGGDGGPARDALLSSPVGLWVDETGTIFVADQGNHRIRKLSR